MQFQYFLKAAAVRVEFMLKEKQLLRIRTAQQRDKIYTMSLAVVRKIFMLKERKY